MELTEQYGMFSKSQHQVCLKGHRIHGEVHSRRSRGGQLHEESQKTNTRVQDCIDSDKNYDATTLKYHCPYQQALDLVQQYERWALSTWRIAMAGVSDQNLPAFRKKNYEIKSTLS